MNLFIRFIYCQLADGNNHWPVAQHMLSSQLVVITEKVGEQRYIKGVEKSEKNLTCKKFFKGTQSPDLAFDWCIYIKNLYYHHSLCLIGES